MSAELTPSQTVGPYLAIGLTWPDGAFAAEADTEGAFWIRGAMFDGVGVPIPDGMIETWQANPDGSFASPEDPRGAVDYPGFRGYARCITDEAGTFAVRTVKPGAVPDGSGGWQAPHIDVSVFARGMLNRVVTRIYFADESAANAQDPVLNSLPAAGRTTLIATATADGYQWDVHVQGENETVFFAL